MKQRKKKLQKNLSKRQRLLAEHSLLTQGERLRMHMNPPMEEQALSLDSDDISIDASEDDSGNSTDVRCTRTKFIELCEMMLCFHAYYKKGEYWKCGDKTSADIFDRAIRKMMRPLLSTLERGEGTNNWNLQKFHEILHLVVQVEQYGNISNTDAGMGERGLNLWAKRHGRRARKASDDIFVESTANMVNELTLITQAHQTMNPNLYSHSNPQEINYGKHSSCKVSGNPIYIITWETDNDETGTMYCNWQSSHDYKGVVELPDEIMDLYEADFFFRVSQTLLSSFNFRLYGNVHHVWRKMPCSS
jgi:hypothetical protein